MCRLFGVIGLQPINLQFWFFNANKRPFVSFSEEHRDGWGIAWYEGREPNLFKEGREDTSHYAFAKIRDIHSQLIVAHLRRASTHIVGACISKNAHPFTYK